VLRELSAALAGDHEYRFLLIMSPFAPLTAQDRALPERGAIWVEPRLVAAAEVVRE
jgi:hypothetical protein